MARAPVARSARQSATCYPCTDDSSHFSSYGMITLDVERQCYDEIPVGSDVVRTPGVAATNKWL